LFKNSPFTYTLRLKICIVDPKGDMILLTPNNAHNLTSKSIVLSGDDEIEIEILSRREQNDEMACVSYDGDTTGRAAVGDRFVISKAANHTKICKLHQRSFLEILRKKMGNYSYRYHGVLLSAACGRNLCELKLPDIPGYCGLSHAKTIFFKKRRQLILRVITDAPENLSKKYERVLREGFLSMDMAQNILVIKTVSGMASAVCAAIDAMKMREIVGSIAGDDTIMCAIRTVDDTYAVMKKIRRTSPFALFHQAPD